MKKLTREEFIEKARSIHGDRYEYSNVIYVNSNTKVRIKDNECGNEFWITPHNLLKGRGCPFCKNKKISNSETKTNEQFIEDAKRVHGNKYDYSKCIYDGANKKVCIICKEHGEFWQNANSHLRGCGCPKCGRKTMQKNKYKDFTTENFIKRARKVHGDKYEYTDKTIYRKATEPLLIECPLHGEFWQTPDKHLSGCGCPKCGGTLKSSTDEFIEKARSIHGNKYDYSQVEYIDARTKICIVCKEHGKFFQTPNEHLRGCGCPSCSHRMSMTEKNILQCIKENCNFSVEENVRGILSDNKELDIYIPSKNIAIEYDGMRWHSERFNKDKNYHLDKLEECNRKGIGLIHIFEAEYLANRELVMNKLLHILGISRFSERIYARKCNIMEIGNKEAKQFLDNNHIQGFCPSSIYLGCFYNECLMAVMSFKKENKVSDKWELTRFASDNTKICDGIGGKMFKYFVRKYNPSEIKSFADRRWTIDINNNLYTKLGFHIDKILQPDYRYTKTQKEYIHKFNFRKQTLNRKYGLPLTMTETEMANELGYYKIWDCGLVRYVWKNAKI